MVNKIEKMIVYHQQFDMLKEIINIINNLLTLVNVGSIKMFKLLLTASVVICDLYLFHIISLLNPDFKLVNNLKSNLLLVRIIYNRLY